ncbi:uncharacterized protein Z520_07297 [Fonsecaea multimorphosa CBS 102226]|uniref:GPI mannosyltransferase 2 n=1 Tax=Fonsecaea multimorphosa CBS 102226 TaxID=1442371 RepID=A0A0D2KKM4_9EURO|nr:uncharacterized protein Z520_07297 [Fonsecaea multimorphosa CBS 102226]KIX97183.1 hypothetical protein Z520_07297 [Fonsecaea multimorphosa CBS 102226]OAL22959.1 hypothetical protein AYO22_06867 [Fonsecaea multimorphosa]
MNPTVWSRYGHDYPITTLFVLFVVWKSVIILITLAAPGVGYDTSTSLLSWEDGGRQIISSAPDGMSNLWLKFVRWDGIYYTHMSDHGHVFEQEWAFGIGLSTAISWTSERLSELGITLEPSSLLAGVLLSHLTHWLSVVQLWALTKALIGDNTSNSLLPFSAAALHIISPAGVFLSAPSSESCFAYLSMSGFLAYFHATRYFRRGLVLAGCTTMIYAGLFFSVATMVRSNGILAGIPFLVEAVTTLLEMLSRGLSASRLFQLASVVAGGLLVAFGMVYPQGLAYRDYCYGRGPEARRPWCNQTIPSIFTWVQSHYWNVGPFRYWTVSNLPLFVLAAPTLSVLTYSALDVLRRPQFLSREMLQSPTSSSAGKRTLLSLALPQLMLAVLAFTSYHVQIITRLSSGYPLWYIWLATKLQTEPRRTSVVIRWMVIYALVQAGLYASFLPPA